jgi:transcriptional regulator with XRE-family HTH domain
MHQDANILKEIRKALNWSQDKIADQTGINRKTFSAYERGVRGRHDVYNVDFCERFLQHMGIDLQRCTAENKIIIVDPTKLISDEIKRLVNAGAYVTQIPMYDTIVTGGIIALYRDEKYVAPAFFIAEQLYPGALFGVRVEGNSMEPAICDGEYVICKEVPTAADIITGHIYLVITESGVETIKTLFIDRSTDELLLVAVNPAYVSKIISLKEVIKLYKIIGQQRREIAINQFAVTFECIKKTGRWQL